MNKTSFLQFSAKQREKALHLPLLKIRTKWQGLWNETTTDGLDNTDAHILSK
jgi:hypothetical protein